MTHFALQFCVDGKYFAQQITVGENTNIVNFFEEMKGLVAANAFRSKRAAMEAAASWNEAAKENGNYRYADFL